MAPVAGQNFANYSADEVSALLGVIPIMGIGDGPFLRIRYLTAAFTSKVGSGGLVSHSRTNDYRAEIQVILEQTSSCNALFSAQFNIDRFRKNGAGVVTWFSEDKQGRSKYTAEKCRIMKAPDVEYARETGQHIWTIEAARLEYFSGGN